MKFNTQSNIFTYRSAIEFSSIFAKFADSKLIQTLTNLPIAQDIKDYILSLPKEHVGFAIGKIKKEPNIDLNTLRLFIDEVKNKENLKQKTQEEIAVSLPKVLQNSVYKNWFIIQFKKYPETKATVNDYVANILIDFIRDYNLNPSSYTLPELLSELDNEVGDFSNIGTEVDKFFQQVRNMETQNMRRYPTRFEPLVRWLKHSFLKLRKEWRKKIEKYMKDNHKSFGDIATEAKALMDAQQAGNLRGQDLPENPLHFAEHGALLNNLESIAHWAHDTFAPDDQDAESKFNAMWSVSELLNEVKTWEDRQAELGKGGKYDPIDPSRIVQGPDNWQNPDFKGYFILELKSANDLKTEGFKMNHCVGGYCDAVDRGSSRIFSLRHVNSPMSPILTIETDSSMRIIRQDYGPSNKKVDQKFHDMVSEWNADKLKDLDPATLSEDDLRELLYQRKPLARKIIDFIFDSADAEKLELMANYCPNLTFEDFTRLSNSKNIEVLRRLARNNIPEEIALKLVNSKDLDLREALASNETINSRKLLNILLQDSRLIRTLSSNPNLDGEMISNIVDDAIRFKSKNLRNIVENIADNPTITPETLRKMFHMDPETFPMRMLNNPNLPLDILEEVLTFNNYEIERRVATNPAVPPAILDKLADLYIADNPTSDVMMSLIVNQSTSEATMTKIFNALKPTDGKLSYSSDERHLMGVMAREAKNVSSAVLNEMLQLAMAANDRHLIEDIKDNRFVRERGGREAWAKYFANPMLLKVAKTFSKKLAKLL